MTIINEGVLNNELTFINIYWQRIIKNFSTFVVHFRKNIQL